MAQMLTLKKFDVTDDTPPQLVFTVAGAAKLIPESVKSEAGAGPRVVKIANDQATALYELGERVKINGSVEMPDEAGAYYAWFKDHFVPQANGGELVVGTADETAEPADETAESEAAPETAESEAPAAPETPSLEEQLGAMKANEVKAYAKDLGLKPGTSKAKTIVVIMAHQNRHADALATTKTAAAFIKANSANGDELNALRELEAGGKARRTLIKNIDKALAALAEPETPEAPEPPTTEPPTPPTTTKASGLSDEDKAAAAAILHGMSGPVGELVKVLSRKRAQTVLRRLVGAVDDGGDVNVDVLLGGGGSSGERRVPICHVVGAKHSVTKKHRDDRGTCVYTVECLEHGAYRLVGLEGNRSDVKVGDEFKHGLELIRRLTGRETGIPTVARWFNLI